MKTVWILAALAIPAAASAQDSCYRRSPPPRRVEVCRARSVPEYYTVRVPYSYWVFDVCRFRWVERRGTRTEERVRYRTVWECGRGCHDRSHRCD